jgi:hypothetical protein
MLRFLLSVALVLSVMACGTKSEQPLLSGVLWGGEGNRMVIKSALDPGALTDTIIVNHQGEFYWNPDTIVPGFYRFEKTNGDGLMLILFSNKPVFIDAQHIIFPRNAKVEGSEFTKGFIDIDINTRAWNDDVDKLIQSTQVPDWIPTPKALKLITEQMDSIRNWYKLQAIQIAVDPMVSMYALIQEAGNHQLFHQWNDLDIFFKTDSMLRNQEIKEVSIFKNQVSRLRRIHNSYLNLLPGTQMPEIPIQNSSGKPGTVHLPEDKIVYLEIRCAKGDSDKALIEADSKKVSQLKHDNLEYHRIWINCAGVSFNGFSQESQSDFIDHFDFSDSFPDLNEVLGLKQLPANFVLVRDGSIVAKNIWDSELDKVLKTLIIKKP